MSSPPLYLSLMVRLRRIDEVAGDLAQEMNRNGALDSETTLGMADAIHADITDVLRGLQSKRSRQI